MQRLLLVLLSSLPLIGTAQYVVNGNAVQLSCNCYRLTQAINTQGGSVWNENLIDLTDPFDFTFNVYLGANDGGADGIAFMLQPISTSIGSTGGGLGYEGISPSLAVEVDTYQNGWDPVYDHIALMSNGVVDHGTANNLMGPVTALASGGNIEDAAEHLMRVVWAPGTNTFSVYMDSDLRVELNTDIVNDLFSGNPEVYWGFTASTGGLNNEHRFCLAMLPDATLSDDEVCLGEAINIADASYSALGAVTAVNWDLGNGQTSDQIDPGDVTYAAPGTYTIVQTITDMAGCTATDSFDVVIDPLPTAAFNTGPVCAGDTTAFDFTGNALGQGTTYSWDHGDGSTASTIDHFHLFAEAGEYDAALLLITADGCTDTVTQSVTVNPVPTATALIDAAYLNGSFSAQGQATTYQWMVGDTILNGQDAEYVFPDSGTYVVTLIVTNEFGCADTAMQSIHIEGMPMLEVPNVFTPNGDDMNRLWEPFVYGYTAAAMKIYNRWGLKVHEMEGTLTAGSDWGWDGRINGNAEAEQGTYYYLLNLTGLDGSTQSRQGFLTLLR
jgi:gliding motility-associated-like protein